MSKIEELAEKEYPIENVGFQCKIAIGSVPEAMDSNEGYRNAYVAGANAVLDAIQSCIDRHEDGCLALEAIILTIDELKNK